jgi:hypothetical protein
MTSRPFPLKIFGEKFRNRIAKREKTVLLAKSDRDRNEGFGGGVHTVLEIPMKGGVIALRKNGVPS